MSTAVVHFAMTRAAETGLIDLDQDINTYLRSWKLPINKHNRTAPVTMRDLLLRARGFRNEYKPEGYAIGSSLPDLKQILNGETPFQGKAVKLVKKIR